MPGRTHRLVDQAGGLFVADYLLGDGVEIDFSPHADRYIGEMHDGDRPVGGLGVAVVSTSRGLMSDREARRRRIGGEILCYVW